MPHAPIRFLHASDFHLEQMLYGLEEVPEHLDTLCIEAPLSGCAAAVRLGD